MSESLQNMGVEEAVGIMRDKIGPDGTVALVSLFRHSQDEVLQRIDAKFDAFEARIDRRFDAIDQRFYAVDRRLDAIDQRFGSVEAKIDGNLRFAITFALSLLGVAAAVAAGIAAYLS